MRETAIEGLMNARLATLPDRPKTVWPNQEYAGPAPYLTVAFVRQDTQRLTLARGFHVLSGTVIVTAVVESNTSSTKIHSLVESIADLFPADLRLGPSDTGEFVSITKRPSIREGFQEGTRYRMAVVIPYRVHSF